MQVRSIAFSRKGVGTILANTFDRAIAERPGVFPNLNRGRTLFVVGDFGGHHQGQSFDTYSFLVLDLDRNQHWLQQQRVFRHQIIRNSRRMAFKSLNDIARRRALVSFLQMAQTIEGFLVTFAISKGRRSMFEGRDPVSESEAVKFRAIWKPAVFERALRIAHLSAFLLSGLSVPSQNLLWIIDEDDIASNVEQLTQLTELFARIWSNYEAHDLGHIRCGTAKSDNGTLEIEDLLAIPDLAAGAIGEAGTRMMRQATFPVKGLWTPVPSSLSWKARTIIDWLAYEACPLQHLTCFVELKSAAPGSRITRVTWEAMQSSLIVPS